MTALLMDIAFILQENAKLWTVLVIVTLKVLSTIGIVNKLHLDNSIE
jgi:hypothetical protein